LYDGTLHSIGSWYAGLPKLHSRSKCFPCLPSAEIAPSAVLFFFLCQAVLKSHLLPLLSTLRKIAWDLPEYIWVFAYSYNFRFWQEAPFFGACIPLSKFFGCLSTAPLMLA